MTGRQLPAHRDIPRTTAADTAVAEPVTEAAHEHDNARIGPGPYRERPVRNTP